MLAAVRQKIERHLYARGFSSAVVRHLLCTQIMITAAALGVGVPAALVSLWPLLFGTGAAIALFSLWHIARFAAVSIHQEFSVALGIRLFSGFTLRLLLTGVVLFTLIVWLRVPVVPLLAGLTTTVAGIAVWGLSRFSRKTVKEA